MDSPMRIKNWSAKLGDFTTNLSISMAKDNSIAVVAVNQARGIGSVFDASPDGVECLVGTHHDGLEEGAARAILQILGVHRVILTMALKDHSIRSVKEVLEEVRKFH